MGMGKTALLKLAYANVWLSLTASGFALAALFACGTKVDAVALYLPFACTFVVYTFDKVLKWDPVADAANDPERSAFIGTYRTPLLVGGALCLLSGGTLALFRGWGVLALFLAPFPIAFAYGTPVLPEGFRYRRLKDITVGKSLTVALTWGVMGVTLPLAASGTPLRTALHTALFAWLALRFFVNTAFFDIGDVEGDRQAGVRTLPVWLGVEGTYVWLFRVLAGSLVAGLAAGALSPTRPGAWVVVLASLAFDHGYLSRGREASRSGGELGFLCDVWADGMGVFTALSVAFAWFFGR